MIKTYLFSDKPISFGNKIILVSNKNCLLLMALRHSQMCYIRAMGPELLSGLLPFLGKGDAAGTL